ncbi:MAG TPA: hypothetical protein VFP63_01100 [Dehalococcoidia bacterium]|nr:hypothetical protein [Dehalococcoidia bacterium]
MRDAAITASQLDGTGDVRLAGFASERTVIGGLVGGFAGLFIGGLVANASGASAPIEVMAALVFGVSGGGALGGMVTGSGDPAAGDRLDAALDRLDEERTAHVAVHCSTAEDATLAAQVLAGLRPIDLYCLDSDGQVAW